MKDENKIDFNKMHSKDGVRMTWNILPNPDTDFPSCKIPPVAILEQLRPSINSVVAKNLPTECSNPACPAILNCYSLVDLENKIWSCPFCHARNSLPEDLFTETELAPELSEEHNTVDYCSSHDLKALIATNETELALADEKGFNQKPLVFLVDNAQTQESLEALKEVLVNKMGEVGVGRKVLLVTFGKNVCVYDLRNDQERRLVLNPVNMFGSAFADGTAAAREQQNEKQKESVVRKKSGLANSLDLVKKSLKTFDEESVLMELLRVSLDINKTLPVLDNDRNSLFGLFQPLSVCEGAFMSALCSLDSEGFVPEWGSRPLQNMGAALLVATALAAACPLGGQICVFAGSPCSSGPGQVAERSFKTPLRAFSDLYVGTKGLLTEKASEFYEALATVAARSQVSVSQFFCAPNQLGLFESSVLSDATGGAVFLHSDFDETNFGLALSRFLSPTTACWSVSASVLFDRNCDAKGVMVDQTSTAERTLDPLAKLCSRGDKTPALTLHLGDCSTASVVVELDVPVGGQDKAKKKSTTHNKQTYIQITTRFLRPAPGVCSAVECVRRVTTLAVPFASTKGAVASGFDAKCAAVYLAKLAAQRNLHHCELSRPGKSAQWLDALLIDFCKSCTDNKRDFTLFPGLEEVVRFSYHLRRSLLLRPDDATPDEATLFALLVNRASVENTCVLVQPVLTVFEVGEEVAAVELDAKELRSNRVLVLDCVKTFLVWKGSEVVLWEKEGLLDSDDGKELKKVLEEARRHVAAVRAQRTLLVAEVLECGQGTSKGRVLLSKLNPSVTHKDIGADKDSDEVVFTESVSWETYKESLLKVVGLTHNFRF